MQRMCCLLMAAFLGAAATAQCATLGITSSAGDVTIALAGAPRAIAIVLVGETAGTTSIPVGAATLDLGLATPFAPIPLGITSANGDVSRTFTVPAGAPAINLMAQGLLTTFSTGPTFGLTFCTSGVEALIVGS
jgi:hypothetical protein